MDAATRGLLIGMVLGDGSISATLRPTKSTDGYVNSILSIWHSVAQLDYCEYKLELIRRTIGTRATLHYRDCTLKNGKTYKLCGFGTSNAYFKVLRRWLYPEGKKRITPEALNMLTPQGIAIWYMDDGHGRGRRNKDGWISAANTSIATMCSKQEADDVVQYFMEAHGIEFKSAPRKESPASHRWFISGNTKASKQFAELVTPHLIPSMLYKVAHVADLHLHECLAPQPFVCRQCGTTELQHSHGLCRNCYNRNRYHANLEESRAYGKLKRRRLVALKKAANHVETKI